MSDAMEPALTPLEQYAVGYRKPPVADQWKKGQSGNPAGKKKGVKNTKTLFLTACQKLVTLKDGKKMTMLETFIHNMAQHAVGGNMKAMDAYLSLMETHSLEAPEKPDFHVVSDAKGVFVMHPVMISDQTVQDIHELKKRVSALLAINSDNADGSEDYVIDQIIDGDH